MEYVKNLKLPLLNLEKAIKATHDYVKELEELKSEGLKRNRPRP